MSTAWVAGSVRAQAIAKRRLGSAGARRLATAATFGEAVESLARSPYGTWVHPGDALAGATRGVAAGLLWNLRVLAGWLPPRGAETLRVLAGWFEIANVEGHLQALDGRPGPPAFALGTLATAWTQIAASASRDELRSALAASPWGDPGSANARDIQLSMRLAWAERMAARVPPTQPWALGAAALLVAREQLIRRQPIPAAAAATANRLLGPGTTQAASLDELREVVPSPARWALAGVPDVGRLWEGEVRWWRRLRSDSAALLAGYRFGPERVLGACGALAADAWLVCGALETAAPGPDQHRRQALEVFDAMA